jgi:polar amino acid transport system substrate-binding protein
MPNKFAVIAALLATLCSAPEAAEDAPRLYITTEASAPSSMLQDGRVIGFNTDKIREIMARAGIEYTIDVLPWKRAYTLALQRRDGCVFSTTRTPEREHLFKWVGPTDEATWVLKGRADRGFQLRTLEDARPYRIGTYNGDSRDHFLRERGFKVDPAPDDLHNPRKLMFDRIDLWATDARTGNTLVAENRWREQIVTVLAFHRTWAYLACNREVPDALIARMNAAAEAMGRDGTMRRIERKYENWSMQPGGGD